METEKRTDWPQLVAAVRLLTGALDHVCTIDVSTRLASPFLFCVPGGGGEVFRHVQEEVIPGLIGGLEATELADDVGVDGYGCQPFGRHTQDGTRSSDIGAIARTVPAQARGGGTRTRPALETPMARHAQSVPASTVQ
jgi:hypothetical protein